MRKEFQGAQEINGGSKFHEFIECEPIKCTFMGFEELEGKFGKQKTALVELDGELVNLPSHAGLNNQLKKCEPGDTLYIELDGVVETKNGSAKNYLVLRKK